MKKINLNNDDVLISCHKKHCDSAIKSVIKKYSESFPEGNIEREKLTYFLTNFYNLTIVSPSSQIPEINKKIENLNFSDKTITKLTEIYLKAYNNFVKDSKIKHSINYETDFNSLLGYKWSSRIFCFILDVKICPYCNASFINSMKTENNGVFSGFTPNGTIKPTLDHFFPKSIYTFFTMSIFNLVPSCYNCNSLIKGEKEFLENFSLNPYEESVDDWLEFYIKINKDNSENAYDILTGDSLKYDISYKPKKNALRPENLHKYIKSMYMVDFFHVLEQYQYHKAFLSNQIKKKIIYNNSYVRELKDIYEIDMSTDAYESEEDLNQLILGKLTNDIFNSINDIPEKQISMTDIEKLVSRLTKDEKAEIFKIMNNKPK